MMLSGCYPYRPILALKLDIEYRPYPVMISADIMTDNITGCCFLD